jgi:hypothetical protein
VQRGQCHPSFRSCQFSYPLPFRGQVCETQSPLPCFPSTVLSSRRPPFLGRVPVSPVPRRHQYYEGATTSRSRIPGHLFVSLPGPTRFLLGSCSLMPALPGGWRPASDQDHCSTGDPLYRCALAWTRAGPLRFPGDPSCAFAPVYDPGRTDDPSPMAVSPVLPLLQREQRLQRVIDFGATAGLQHLLSTLHERCCHHPCKTRFRLAGWPLPGGS